MNIREIDFSSELNFVTSRSGGKGGQHVNKTETKVELNFHIEKSRFLTEEQKQSLKEKLANKITNEGFLQVVVQQERSQLKNKHIAVEKFYRLLEEGLEKKKKRKPSKVPKAVKEKRLREKKIRSQRKINRKDPEI